VLSLGAKVSLILMAIPLLGMIASALALGETVTVVGAVGVIAIGRRGDEHPR